VSDRIERADAHAEGRAAAHREDLFALLAQPSVSATGEGMGDCVDLVEATCLEYGFDDVRVVGTDGHPAVVARAFAGDGGGDGPDPDAPTVLVYGHYDVQPVDPERWTSPPFEPTVRAGPDGRERIYARGAGDNKGQWFAHLVAVEALRATGDLPLNVTLLLEGEEESGSPHIVDVVRENADLLAADLFLMADGPVHESGRPQVLLGSRGLLYVELEVRGANRDLHSGNYGGPVPNAAWGAVHLLASMMGPDGVVDVDGFYDDVREPSAEERALLEALPDDEGALRAELDLPALAPGPGESHHERLTVYPTLNVAGFGSGYTGEGSKTVLPSTATVKLESRLVPDQTPAETLARLERHVEAHAPEWARVEVTDLGGMDPHRTPPSAPGVDAVRAAVADAWDADPVVMPSIGASGPDYAFAEALSVPCVVVPYANHDESNHAPDENLALDCFRNGVRTSVRALVALADDLSGDADGAA
jgi:acetylornithine deacetylase/succinyl-diaminopimelate desuccinylase-like protein